MASKTAKFDTEVNRAPALRISHIVFGRENDSDGPGGRETARNYLENALSAPFSRACKRPAQTV